MTFVQSNSADTSPCAHLVIKIRCALRAALSGWHRQTHNPLQHAAKQYIAEGYNWTVDFDLEKFFDRVNHDKLMGQIAKRIEDKRLLKLIGAFLME
jgi:hypothetical protein